MFQIVWRVYDDLNGGDVANFPQPANDPVAETGDDSTAFELYGKTVTEMAAIEFARSLNATQDLSIPRTLRHRYLVARGILNREHRLPAFRNVVI